MDLDGFEIKNKDIFVGTFVFLGSMIMGYIVSIISHT